ncbi:MAG: hypothetical protein KY459_13010 [Acidobacteria bacterium]|nr:hypothetical protein [Acidobacteriota bacterium]
MKTKIFLSLLAIMAMPLTALDPSVMESTEIVAQDAADQSVKVEHKTEIATIGADNLKSSDLTAIRRPDGGVEVDLDGRFGHALVAHVSPDGTITYACTDSHETVAKVLSQDAKVSASEAEKNR